jgi:glycosyltransferase involved in cell wall biosynthesis
MRILLVGNYGPDGQQSMTRYADWIKEVCRANGHEVTLIHPEPILGPLFKNAFWKKWAGYLDKFWLFRRKLREQARRHDLIHITDHSNAMYVRFFDKCRCVVTCHDLLAVRSARGEFPDQRTRWSGRFLQRWIESGLRDSRNVICVSQKTHADLIRLIGHSRAHISVIYHALNRSIERAGKLTPKMMGKFGISEDTTFLLHVGGNQWYKNRPGVLRIFSALIKYPEWCEAKLIMAGKAFTQEMRRFVHREGLCDRVIEACDVPDDELTVLYSNAKALLFPSLQEGFGWPILEAQACGCPVITSKRAPMTEVAGRGAILIEPEDPLSAADQIRSQTHNLDRAATLGFENLTRFQRNDVARRYMDFYKQVQNASCGLRWGTSLKTDEEQLATGASERVTADNVDQYS